MAGAVPQIHFLLSWEGNGRIVLCACERKGYFVEGSRDTIMNGNTLFHVTDDPAKVTCRTCLRKMKK